MNNKTTKKVIEPYQTPEEQFDFNYSQDEIEEYKLAIDKILENQENINYNEICRKKVIEKFIQLGRNISAQRKKVKYSQNELAELLDISREHLAKIETAKRAVSLDLLIDIAEKLNIKVKDLIDF